MAKWFYKTGNRGFGPVDASVLRQLASGGLLRPTDAVKREDMPAWVPASQINGLFANEKPSERPPLRAPTPPVSAVQPANQPPNEPGSLDFLNSATPANRPPNEPGSLDFLSSATPAIRRNAGTHPASRAPLVVGTVVAVVAVLTLGVFFAGRLKAPIGFDIGKIGGGSDYRLGQEFSLGGYKYIVTDVSQRQSIGNQYFGASADQGATFVVVRYSIENCTKESQTVMSDDFRIVDSQGRKFMPDSKANTALLSEGHKDLLLSELQPGIKHDMTQAFEVPTQALNSTLTLVVPEKGFWGSDEARITVSVK